jgi:hypothetical protein
LLIKLDQYLLDDIQINLLTYRNRLVEGSMDYIIGCIYKLQKNININTNILCDRLLDDFLTNLPVIKLGSQFFLLVIYREYMSKLSNNFEFYEKTFNKVKKLYNYIDNEVIFSIDSIDIEDIITVVECFSQMQLGTPELYLAIDKKIGLNINSFKPASYLRLLDSFARSNNYRDKFLFLLQKKVIENKQLINLSELAKIIRIYSAIKVDSITLQEKLEEYFKANLDGLNDYDIADLVFAYSNPNLPNKSFLIDLEENIRLRLDRLISDNKYDLIIDFLLSFIKSTKGSKEFKDNLLDLILNMNPGFELESVSVFKMYHAFSEVGLDYSKLKQFDDMLTRNLIYFNHDELTFLKVNFLKLNCTNTGLMMILTRLVAIPNDVERRQLINQVYQMSLKNKT